MHLVPARAAIRSGALVLVLASALSACGGGSGSGNTVTTATYPSTGYYVPVYRWAGLNRVGLSLVHASTPTVEYVVSAPGSSIDANWTLYGAQQNGSSVNVIPGYLLYVQAGTLYELPLLANGSKPGATTVPTGLVACAISNSHTPNSAPETAQVIIRTAGTDGSCGTADDGEARVNLATPLSATTVQNSGYTYKGYVYSGIQAQPNIWVEASSSGALYRDDGSTLQLLRASNGNMPTRLAGYNTSLLLQDGSQLSMVSYSAGAWQVVPVAGTTGSWTLAGSDNSNYYVYTTAGGPGSSWQLLAIPMSGNSATTLASGSGSVAYASVGSSQVFVSVLGASYNYLSMVAKNGSAATAVDTNDTTVRDLVVILGGGRHVLYKAKYSGSSFVGGQVSSIDEAGATVALAANAQLASFVIPGSFAASTAGLPMQLSFVSNSSYMTDFSGSQLKTFDSSTGSLTINGTLPTSSALGTANVFWRGGDAYAATGGILVTATNASGFLEPPARVYFYNPSQANSLTQTTSQQ
ncbi:MAG: hypothetical protein PSX71_01565 [bacterium]|nr:hypothetical protein [bacterium]